MAQPRSIVEGIRTPTPTHTATDPAKEHELVFGTKSSETGRGKGRARTEGLNTRIRADLASALKRASLQRRLDEVYPNTIAEIVEEALEPWLKKNGYIA